MKNKYMSDDGILWINKPIAEPNEWKDSVIPVFASRESLLKALAECEEELRGGNLVDNYRNAVTYEADLILKKYSSINLDNLFDELDKQEDTLEQIVDATVWILFNYQDYLAVSLQDKELLDDIAEDLIPSDKPESGISGFEFVDDCKDEYYWFIQTSEVPLSNLCIFKNLTENEIKLYKESEEVYEKGNSDKEYSILQKLQAISALRLAHKVKEGNF